MKKLTKNRLKKLIRKAKFSCLNDKKCHSKKRMKKIENNILKNYVKNR